ncbi:hypothetical protein [Williamsia sp. DF01-3]|uniref:hypothetical protein n=1 Tax=Williamsia sp. DF01-3 TaxID=2934157 RepID=UPI001FF21F67|nr:hypothetical protein [Williamsia sp. DF01-3]MCK0517870.1 hypothetical protein [Williamsia sp. DF01-3]
MEGQPDLSADVLEAFRAAVPVGLQAAGELILTESNLDSPTLAGDLDSTGSVVVDGTEMGVGYDSEYARKQHENTWYQHPQGDKPKFLENALTNKADAALDLLSTSIGEALGG